MSVGNGIGEPARCDASDILLEQDIGLVVGRSGSCDRVIDHPSVSRRHAKLTLREGYLEVEDLGSSGGTWVKDGRIDSAVARDNDTVRFGAAGPVYRLDLAGRRLVRERAVRGMRVALADVSVERDGQVLIADVSLTIEPGEFVGIIGVSGGGKSLIIGCITTTVERTRGELLFDGRRVDDTCIDDYRAAIGVVSQDDVVHGALTVRENLLTAATIRHPRDPEEKRNSLVRQIMELLDLEKRADSVVDVLSGGERKRVSIGMELLNRPRLLVLDEPTSGLDPRLQTELMSTLRRLSREGMTVLCTTHTTETLHYFDRVMVLGRNRAGQRVLCFQGRPEDLWARFGVSPGAAADLYKQLASEGVSAVRPVEYSGVRTSRRVNVMPRRPVPDGTSLLRQAAVVARRSLLSFMREGAGAEVSAAGNALVRGWRRCPNVVMAVLQPIALAVLIVLTQHAQKRSAFVHFFLVIAAIWMGMTATVREVVREVRQRPLYQRDRLAGLAPGAYLGGKAVFAAVIVVAQTFLLYLTARMAVPLFMSVEHDEIQRQQLLNASWAVGFAVLAIAGMSGAIAGMLISVMSRSERAAVGFLPLAILPQVLFSRVAFGHGGEGWSELSPFGPIVDLLRYFRSPDATVVDISIAIVSLPLFSRPELGMLDMPASGIAGLIVVGEWVYCAILMATCVLVLYKALGIRERSWFALR